MVLSAISYHFTPFQKDNICSFSFSQGQSVLISVVQPVQQQRMTGPQELKLNYYYSRDRSWTSIQPWNYSSKKDKWDALIHRHSGELSTFYGEENGLSVYLRVIFIQCKFAWFECCWVEIILLNESCGAVKNWMILGLLYLWAVLHLSDDLRVQWSVVAETLGSSCRRRLSELRTFHLSLQRWVASDGVQDAVSADWPLVCPLHGGGL